jgi:hypothetical protein
MRHRDTRPPIARRRVRTAPRSAIATKRGQSPQRTRDRRPGSTPTVGSAAGSPRRPGERCQRDVGPPLVPLVHRWWITINSRYEIQLAFWQSDKDRLTEKAVEESRMTPYERDVDQEDYEGRKEETCSSSGTTPAPRRSTRLATTTWLLARPQDRATWRPGSRLQRATPSRRYSPTARRPKRSTARRFAAGRTHVRDQRGECDAKPAVLRVAQRHE